FEDYAWLYLTAHGFDYLVIHRWTWEGRPVPEPLDRVQERLSAGIVFEDESAVVIDRRRLPIPERPALLCTTGWRDRINWRGAHAGIVEEDARILVYNPTPEFPLQLRVEASAYREPRVLRLLSE